MNVKRLASGLAALSIAAVALVGCGGSKPATPAAAPATPAPATQPAAQPAAPSFKGLIVSGDVVRSTFNIPADQAPDKGCVLNSRFLHNEGIVFRVKVTDPATGKLMDDKAIKSAELTINGVDKPIPMKYGAHGKPPATVDNFWTGAFHIDEKFPSGKLTYKITVTSNDGRTGELASTKINSDSSDLVVLDGKIPVLPAATK